MSLTEMFQTNESLETKGVWLQYGETEEVVNDESGEVVVEGGLPIRIRIARAGGANKAYNKAMQLAVRPVQRIVAQMPVERQTAIIQGVFARTVILEWENIDIEGDFDVPCTPENAMRLFDALPALWEDIQEQASGITIFREAVREEVLGN